MLAVQQWHPHRTRFSACSKWNRVLGLSKPTPHNAGVTRHLTTIRRTTAQLQTRLRAHAQSQAHIQSLPLLSIRIQPTCWSICSAASAAAAPTGSGPHSPPPASDMQRHAWPAWQHSSRASRSLPTACEATHSVTQHGSQPAAAAAAAHQGRAGVQLAKGISLA